MIILIKYICLYVLDYDNINKVYTILYYIEGQYCTLSYDIILFCNT